MIAGWVYKNVLRYPEHIRSRMYLMADVTYQLARGDRHFLDPDVGPMAVHDAWSELDQYVQELTRDLHGSSSSPRPGRLTRACSRQAG